MILKFSSYFFLGSISTLAFANHDFHQVLTCPSSTSQSHFCSAKNIERYKTALKTQKANFDKKYILLNSGNDEVLELIALDTESGIGYPLPYQFKGLQDTQGNILKRPSYYYSLHSSRLCLKGTQYDLESTVAIQENLNIKNCFKIVHDTERSGFEAIFNSKVHYQYLEKEQQWKKLPKS